MKRNKLVVVLTCIAFLFASDASAQFFKKLGKAVEQVTKAIDKGTEILGGDSGNQTTTAASTSEVGYYQPTEPDKFDSDGIYMAKRKAMIPYVTSATKQIVWDKAVTDFNEFTDGVARVIAGGEHIYIDTQGNRLFSRNSDRRLIYQNGSALTFGSVDGKSMPILLNKNGKYTRSFPDVVEITDFVDGIAAMKYKFVNRNGTQCFIVYIDTNGDRALDSLYFEGKDNEHLRELRPFCDNLSAYYDYNEGKWGYFNRNGKIAITPRFMQVHNFSEGLASVSCDVNGTEKWGFIDVNGNFVIQPVYSYEPGDFGCGFAPVRKRDGGYCYIDKAGAVRSDTYRQITNFNNGYALVRAGAFGQYVFNKDMKPVSVIGTTWAIPVADNHNSWKSLRWEGNVMYSEHSMFTYKGDIIFDKLYGRFRHGLAPWSGRDKNGTTRTGYINPKGEIVFEFVEPEF